MNPMQGNQSRKNRRVVLIGFLAILAVVAWYAGRTWYDKHRDTETLATEPSDEVNLTDLKFLAPKEVLARLDRKENILLIDIRPRESYNIEHIVDAVSIPATTLNTFTPGSGQLVIIISGPELPNDILRGVHLLFKERKFQFAFLQGSIVDWRLAGGSTISSGDPDSSLDYSKVIFIENDQVLPLAESLVSPLFLDVRSVESYAQSHLPGAINIPLSELEKQRTEIPRQKSIFVYGNNDYTSYQGGVRLFDLGFFGARVIRGGYELWVEKKLPIETPEKAPSSTPTPQRP